MFWIGGSNGRRPNWVRVQALTWNVSAVPRDLLSAVVAHGVRPCDPCSCGSNSDPRGRPGTCPSVAVMIDDKRDDRPHVQPKFLDRGGRFFGAAVTGGGKEYFASGSPHQSHDKNLLSGHRSLSAGSRFATPGPLPYLLVAHPSLPCPPGRRGSPPTKSSTPSWRRTPEKPCSSSMRNPDFTIEPDDEKFGGDMGTAPISDCGTAKRPNALNIPFDRATGSLPRRRWSR